MKTKNCKIFSALTTLVIISLLATPLRAQMTIGATKTPESFSILELVSNGNRGLRLPQLTEQQKEDLEQSLITATDKALGLRIFNLSTKCVETWNGKTWIKECETGIDTQTQLPPFTCEECTMQGVEFMRYNLGADPSLDTPKKQMEYLATHSFDALDAHVYGGLFQWGRKDWDYAVDAENFRRYGINTSGTGAKLYYSDWDKKIYATTKQPSKNGVARFIYPDNTNEDNWYPNAKNTHAINDTLWGNGVEASSYRDKNDKEFTSGVYLTETGKYYQQRVKTINDPCPEGWRVPTQDEFEMLINYDCTPYTAKTGGMTTGSGVRTVETGHGLTWVKVDNNGKSTGNLTRDTNCGYAVYATAEWNSAADGYKDGSLALYDDSAPNPILFFPIAWFRSASNGGIYSDFVTGVYASSTIKGGKIHFLALTNDWVNAFSTNNEFRAHGYSIRCCRTVEW
jgi:uncharacterized protein (TIGR02145 family)